MTAKGAWHTISQHTHPTRVFWFLLAIGLLPRLFLLIALSGEGFHSDGRWYLSEADKVLSGASFDPYWPPALPHFLAGIKALFGNSEWIIRLAMLGIWIGFIRLFYLIAQQWAGAKWALLGGLFFSFFPTFIHQSVEPLSQIPAATCLLGFVWFSRCEKSRHWLLAGLFMGLLVLLRPSALLILPFALVYFWRKQGLSLQKLLLFAGAALSLIGLWEVRAYALSDRLVPINDANARNFFLGNNEHTPLYKTWYLGSHWAGQPDISPDFRSKLTEIDALAAGERNARFRSEALGHIGERPDLFALRSLSRIRTFLAFDSFTGSFFLRNYGVQQTLAFGIIGLDALFFCFLILLALFLLFGAASLSSASIFLWLGLLYAFPYFFSFSHPSFHLPVLPLIALFVLTELSRVKGRLICLPVSVSRRWALLVTLLLFIFIQVEWIIQML